MKKIAAVLKKEILYVGLNNSFVFGRIMTAYPLDDHDLAQAIARFGGQWPSILRPGDVFRGFAPIPQCLHHRGMGYLPIIAAEGDLVGLLGFHTDTLDKPIAALAGLIKRGSIVEVQTSYQFLVVRPALLADAAALLSAASALARMFRFFDGEQIDIRSLV